MGQAGKIRGRQSGVIPQSRQIFHNLPFGEPRDLRRKPRAHIPCTYRLAGPRRSEAAQPKINFLKSSRSPGAGRRRPMPGVRPSAGCRPVRDSTLAAWYPSLYAPRTGGAYDSHHRTAGVAGRTRRRGGLVAARGARSRRRCQWSNLLAASDPRTRISSESFERARCKRVRRRQKPVD